MEILPTLAGLLLIGAEGYQVGDGFEWTPTPCQVWQGNGCARSAVVVPLERLAPYRIIVTGEAAPDRMTPLTRERVWLERHRFLPADADLDGVISVSDLAAFTAGGPWDFNGDGLVNAIDLSEFVAEMQRTSRAAEPRR